MKQVRLTEAHASVYEERIVVAAWKVADGLAESSGELVAPADYEPRKRQAGVQLADDRGHRLGGRRLCRWAVRADLLQLWRRMRRQRFGLGPVGTGLDAELEAFAEDAAGEREEELAVLILDPLGGEEAGRCDDQCVFR